MSNTIEQITKKLFRARIDELKNQSTYDTLGVKQIDYYLFAELIVKDCADDVEDFTMMDEVALDEYQEINAKDYLLSRLGATVPLENK